MPRDYARPRDPVRRGNNNRSGAATRRAPEPSSGPGIPGWVYLMVGLAIGLAVAVFAYISRPSNKVALGAAADPAVAAAAKDDAKKPIALPPKQPSRFAFYEMLPSYEVVIPRDTVKPASGPGQQPTAAPTAPADVKAAIAAPGQYLIQVGAYRSSKKPTERVLQLPWPMSKHGSSRSRSMRTTPGIASASVRSAVSKPRRTPSSGSTRTASKACW